MLRLRQFSAATALIMGAALAPLASATIIDFEDVPGLDTNSSVFLEDGYHGFNWSGGFGSNSWVASTGSSGLFPGLNAFSGYNYVWSNGGTDLTMDGATFALNALCIRSGYATSQDVTITGYLAGNQVKTATLTLTQNYQIVLLNFSGVDSVRFSSTNNILIDDITVNAVPEPETYAMLMAGLGLVGYAARRRNTQQA